MLRSCGTSGGTTVLASLVNKKFRNLSVSAMTSAFDACVVFASFFVYHQGEPFTAKLDPVLLALISLLVTSKICDFVLQGFKVAYRFEIITRPRGGAGKGDHGKDASRRYRNKCDGHVFA